jgi:hypothetical protein
MNKSKRLTHYMTVSPIAFRHNLRLSPTPAHAQPRGIRTYRREPLVFHGVLPLKRPSITSGIRKFAGLCEDKDARAVSKEHPGEG